MTDLLLVVGSTREGRNGRKVADWFLEKAGPVSADVRWSVADLLDYDLPWFTSARPPAWAGPDPHPSVQRWAEAVAQSDGFVWVASEYNHGYAAPLKNAIDHLATEWVRKPVAMVTYGGVTGGARAAEQLRSVAVELQMAPVRFGIHLPLMGIMGPDGSLTPPDTAAAAVGDVVRDLAWWAEALKAARTVTAPV